MYNYPENVRNKTEHFIVGFNPPATSKQKKDILQYKKVCSEYVIKAWKISLLCLNASPSRMTSRRPGPRV